MKNIIMALAGSLAVLTAVPAAAEDLVIHYRDLNLATEQGQKTLDRRIDTAARKYCSYGEPVTGTRLPSAGAKRCYEQALAEARKSVAAIVADQQRGG